MEIFCTLNKNNIHNDSVQLETTETQVYYRLLDLSEREKSAYLRQLKSENPALYMEVLPLLEADEQDGLTQLLNFHVSNTEQPEIDYSNQRVGRYLISQELGRGGMGVVYAACRADKIFDHQLAIKFLHHSLTNILDQKALFSEAQSLATLNHPNIAKVFDGGLHEQSAYIVMEQIQGVSLDQMLLQSNLSDNQKLKLFIQICLGLEHAHQNGVVHGDIKPENILIDENRQVKLIDFNLTQNQHSQREANHLLAFSEHYASPEQKSGAIIGGQSDVYSLGKLLAFLLPDSSTNSDIHFVAHKATQKCPQDRYQGVEQLRKDIERIIAIQPISLKKHVPFYASTRLFQRHPIPSFLAILLLLCGITFSTVLVVKNRQLEQEKLIAENMMFEVTSMMFHSTAPQARHISAHTMLDLTRRRILSNPDIPKHIKQKMLIAMMTPSSTAPSTKPEPNNAQL